MALLPKAAGKIAENYTIYKSELCSYIFMKLI